MRVAEVMRPFMLVLASLVAAAPFIAQMSFAQAAGSKRAQTPADQALLTPPPRAQCELSKPPEGIGANDARVAMLDYERQCYRQLAEIERAKLVELQAAARTKNKAVHGNNRRVYKRPIRYRGRPDPLLAGR